MPTNRAMSQAALSNRHRLSLKVTPVEYRIKWDDKTQTWNVLRNGVATDVVLRRKRASAVASAIREAKVEFNTSDSSVVVTCLEGYRLETIWRGTQLPVSG